jgi:putative colanic acid biosynthesis UDP-glucose lipid carrier transferase
MTGATLLGVLVFGFIAEFGGLYRPWRTESLSREVGDVLVTWIAVPVALILYGFITKTSAEYSRVVSFVWFMLAPTFLCSLRVGVRLTLRMARARGRNLRWVAIAGATPEAERMAQVLEQKPWLGMRLIGIFDDRGDDRRHPIDRVDCHVLGGFDDLLRCAREGAIDIIYVALPMRAEARYSLLFRALTDTTVTVYLIADFFAYAMLRARWGEVGGIPVVSIHDTPFQGVVGWLKRMEDLVLGLLILGVSALPMLLIALLVKLSSKGPVFFRQRRYGLNGKPIRVLKFRTMTVCEDGPYIKQVEKDDPRITPIGRLLRRWSLDELPQFLQVMTGELSIVGPRPHAIAHNEEYRGLIEGYMLRHKVKPGITGWAQVNGWRGDTLELEKMQQRVQHDLAYIRDWNLLWDLKIILRTIFDATSRRNAR